MKPLSSTQLTIESLAKVSIQGSVLPILLSSNNSYSNNSYSNNSHSNSSHSNALCPEAHESAKREGLNPRMLTCRTFRRRCRQTDSVVTILVAVGLGLVAPEAIAQTGDQTILRRPDGSFEIDSNAFDIQTGELENESNIPLPTILPTDIVEGVSQPVNRQQEVPNNIEIRPDIPFIEESFLEISNQSNQGDDSVGFDIRPETVEIQTQFDLRYRQGDYNFGEGIQVTVFGPNGEVKSQETVFVRGDAVTVGADGELLPNAERWGLGL